NVVPQVIVVDSIDLPIHLVPACPVHRTKSSCRVASKSRLECDELREIAPVQWSILNGRSGNGCRLGFRRCIQCHSSCRHLDCRGRLDQSKPYRQSINRACANRYAVRCEDSESTDGNNDLIRAKRKVLKNKFTVARCQRGVPYS